MRALIGLVLFGGLMACAPTTRLTRLDPTIRPPRDVNLVEVYTSVPERDYSVIALWSTKKQSLGTGTAKLMHRARTSAAELGADAVLVEIERGLGDPVMMPAGGDVLLPLPTTAFRVRAQVLVWR
jgi:hypothetical protein